MVREKLITPREAAQILGVSYPTVKQWIYEKKLQTVKRPAGIIGSRSRSLISFCISPFQRGDVSHRRSAFRRISGRNQLIGRVIGIKTDGLIAQVSVVIGGQRINAIVTADAVREMRLKTGETIAALIKSTEVMLLRP